MIKLHGDFLYDSIKNTTSELSNLETNMREKLSEFSREYGLIVVGYSGSDKSVMDALSVLARNQAAFRNGVYWCLRRGTVPGTKLRQFLRHDRVYWIEIDGFDEFMADAAAGLGLGLPSGVTSPHNAAISRSAHLFDEESVNYNRHPRIIEARAICSETYKLVCELLHSHGLRSSKNHAPERFAELADDIADYTGRLLQVEASMAAREFVKAEAILRELLYKAPSSRQWPVIRKLTVCLLDKGTSSDEMKPLLASLPEHGRSEDYTHCSYCALFVNETDLALKYANMALDLSPGNAAALVNKGLAHLQNADFDQVSEISTTLIDERMSLRFQAAGFAMRGDIGHVVAPLQRAIALREYSPESALRDVAFRMYWPNTVFTEALRPFMKERKLILSDRIDNYPMSSGEQEMLARQASPSLTVVK